MYSASVWRLDSDLIALHEEALMLHSRESGGELRETQSLQVDAGVGFFETL